MKATLQVRMSQHLALTPQLQQSIRLLQLSTLELHQEVEQMLEANPFLEVDEEVWTEPGLAEQLGAADRLTASSELAEHTTSTADVDAGAVAEVGAESIDLATPGADDWENGTEADDFDGIRETPSLTSGNASPDDDGDALERNAPEISLQDHLKQQLRNLRLSADDAAAVEALIESLNDEGYLDGTLEEIAQRICESLDITDPDACETILSQLKCGLKWLQSMEPIGVGAADLADCLVLQLRAMERCEAQAVAILICKHHLELLAKRDSKKLMALTGADEELLKAAHSMILKCEPKPARAFSPAESNIIVPDVIIVKAGRQWKAVLNPDVMPKLRINDLYAQAIKSHRHSEAGQGLSTRLQEARWFMKNILQRFDTILRVSQAIVERQINFFTHGAIAMKPLVLREIADELGLHESTISRVTTAKYMATPFGTYELKYFFGSSLNTDAGGNASSTAVRALIKQFVAAEDTKKPLSDSQISVMLEEQGIQVARRTVAKYREALKIAPANLRKAL